MLLSEWYPLLQHLTCPTILIPLTTSNLEEDIAQAINQLGPVFVRLDERSPKHFEPCETPKQVIECLAADRTASILGTSKFLCLRKWQDFSNLVEVRCFIDGKVTAMCQNDAQFDSNCLEKELAMSIKAAALELLQQILPLLPKRCTIDLAIDRDSLNAQVVEVNSHWTEFADTGLFDDDNPADVAYLRFGPCILRYFASDFYNLDEV
jgi:hypothetical protein